MTRVRMLTIDQSYFTQLREYALDFRRDAMKVEWAIDRAVMGYAMATLSFAQRRSRGFLDPLQKNPAQAWKIPVRRITGAYLQGWKVEMLTPGMWRTYNNSREAYYIEFGINHQSTGVVGPHGQRVRIRRPILRLSIIDAVSFANASNMPWREFMSVYHYASPVAELSEGAIRQTLNAGRGFVYGTIATEGAIGAMTVR